MVRKREETEEEEIARIKMPEEGQVLGIIIQALGAARFRVVCTDGHERICRVPGRFRRRLWVRVGDAVIVEPWPLQSEERGDIVHRYTRLQKEWLIKNGHLTLEESW